MEETGDPEKTTDLRKVNIQILPYNSAGFVDARTRDFRSERHCLLYTTLLDHLKKAIRRQATSDVGSDWTCFASHQEYFINTAPVTLEMVEETEIPAENHQTAARKLRKTLEREVLAALGLDSRKSELRDTNIRK